MVFSSAVFLFVFLPIVCALYFCIPKIKAKNNFLVVASLIFYAFGEPVYVLLMIGSILVNYILGRGIGLFAKRNCVAGKRSILITAIAANLGVLCIFKYTGFLIENIHEIFGVRLPVPSITLPVGISFFTFQALSYVIDAPVIMAAGAFVSGSSIELSADGPIKPPYAVYFQGGLTWQHAKLGILKAFQNMVNDELITLK